MLVAFAVCPHPPALVPDLAQGAAPELEDLRSACDAAAQSLVDAQPDRMVVITSADRDRHWGSEAVADFSPYGLDRPAAARGRRLPLGLSVGAWLLDRNTASVPRRYATTGGTACDVAELRTALLVMADGSAKRNTSAPGYLDERAEPYDAAIATALGSVDADALERLDPALADELWVQGVAALHALGATLRAEAERTNAAPTAKLLYDAAPYGVGYWVASGVLTPPAPS